MERSLSVSQGAALSIGAVLGTGVITLPALAVQLAGPASLIAWIALIALSIPLATTFATMGARFPDRGGVSTYVERAFGPYAAGAIGWCFFFAIPMAAPPAGLMAGWYVADAFGGGRTTALAVAVVLIAGIGLLNARGLRLSGHVQLCLTAVLATLIAVAVLVAAPHAQTSNLHPFIPHGWTGVGAAAALLVWGFAGWEAVAPLAGEYRHPHTDLPRATGIAILVVGALYLALAAVTVLVLGPAAAGSKAPLSDLLTAGLGGSAKTITAVVAVLLTAGTMNAYYAGVSRLGAALARDGALPRWLATGGEPGQVPLRSLAVVMVMGLGSLVVTTALGLKLSTTMLLATGCFTTVYVVATGAAVRLLPRGRRPWWIAVLAFASVFALLLTGLSHLWWAAGIAVLSAVYRRLTPARPVCVNPQAERHPTRGASRSS
ncbi:amino acid permease [Flexivirga meconopsidis]|uniref:amino acid permease n=1 Tax=Flexivirga meconopsidis TaxID=2977121 RepID=UPI00223EEA3C|nr:amino acid permease [Flexivirga meconopsidis]